MCVKLEQFCLLRCSNGDGPAKSIRASAFIYQPRRESGVWMLQVTDLELLIFEARYVPAMAPSG